MARFAFSFAITHRNVFIIAVVGISLYFPFINIHYVLQYAATENVSHAYIIHIDLYHYGLFNETFSNILDHV